MTSETDEFERFMFCIAFYSWGNIQNSLQNILGNSHGDIDNNFQLFMANMDFLFIRGMLLYLYVFVFLFLLEFVAYAMIGLRP